MKKPHPRPVLFPSDDSSFPRAQVGGKHIDIATFANTKLDRCLHETREKAMFLDIIFAILSLSHKKPVHAFADLKLDTTKTFFWRRCWTRPLPTKC